MEDLSKGTCTIEFRLLHALGDLMMLPFEMFANKSTRKEVCPTFPTPLIRRVVCSFVPDEFSPNPIPNELIEALDIEAGDSTPKELASATQVQGPVLPIVREKLAAKFLKLTEEMKSFDASANLRVKRTNKNHLGARLRRTAEAEKEEKK